MSAHHVQAIAECVEEQPGAGGVLTLRTQVHEADHLLPMIAHPVTNETAESVVRAFTRSCHAAARRRRPPSGLR